MVLSLPEIYGAEGEFPCWLAFLDLDTLILLQRHWRPPLSWPVMLVMLCVGTDRLLPDAVPSWGAPMLEFLAFLLDFIQIRRVGSGRLVVHTDRRTLSYGFSPLSEVPCLPTAGEVVLDDSVRDHYYLPFSAGSLPTIQSVRSRPNPAPVLFVFLASATLAGTMLFQVMDWRVRREQSSRLHRMSNPMRESGPDNASGDAVHDRNP